MQAGVSSTFDADVVEVAGVPERIEVALDQGRIIEVALVREEAGEDGFLRNAAVSDDLRLTERLAACTRRETGAAWASSLKGKDWAPLRSHRRQQQGHLRGGSG